MIKLTQDSRDLSFHEKYGGVSDFSDELIFTDKTPDFIQPAGNVKCTAISPCDVATDIDGVEYDIDDLYNRYPHGNGGANPRDAVNEVIKGGLKPKVNSSGIRFKPFKSYYTAHTGPLSPFNNVRSALSSSGYPLIMWSTWDSGWTFSTMLPKQTNTACYHVYTIEGWTMKMGKPHLIVEAWLGRKQYMSEEVFNDTIKKLGSNTCVLCTDEVDRKRIKTTLDTVTDMVKNLVLSVQLFLKKKI